MFRTILFASLIVLASGSKGQNQESTSLNIQSGWKFSLGDKPSWSAPSFDDSQWKSIAIGKPWEEQGYPNQDGFAWYRLQVHIPAKLQHHPDLKKYGNLRLQLGKIDDVDQTWWNGKLIGETGSIQNPYTPRWADVRSYPVPQQFIRWGQDNTIAIRVFDGNNDGGMYEGPYRLRIASWQDLTTLNLNLGRGDGIYPGSNNTPLSAEISNDSMDPLQGSIKWTISSDQGEHVATTSSDLSIPAKGTKTATCNYQLSEPGFYKVECLFQNNAHLRTVSTTLVLGYRPEAIKTDLTRQPDFDQFWQQTLSELSTIEPEFEIVAKPEYDTQTHKTYEITMRSLGRVRVRGWYEQPIAKGPHPALLRVPGYTETMSPTGASDPWAVFSFNIRAHGNSQDDISGTPQDYWLRGLDNRDEYFYRGAYADCIRAVDFLASRKEIDVSRIAVTGGSQGGGLSLATAALDPRISLCAPDIPYLSNWQRYFKTSHWPEMDAWIDAKPHRTWENTLRTMSYFDTLNLAERITCPVFLGIGLQDEVCPPVTIFAVYNKLKVEKQYRIYPYAGHWVDPPHHEERRDWLSKHFFSDAVEVE